MKVTTLILCFASAFLLSCNQADSKKVNQSSPLTVNNVEEKLSILQLDERLIEADSLVFVFYKDPQGKDSLRYTRFYKQYATVDSSLVNFVKSNLTEPTTRFERIKKCRSEGKIWCFRKGEIFQTVYFSSFNDECSFLYIIKNGQFYYATISKEMSKKLKELQVKALEPL